MMAILDHLDRSIHKCPIESEEIRSLRYQYALARSPCASNETEGAKGAREAIRLK